MRAGRAGWLGQPALLGGSARGLYKPRLAVEPAQSACSHSSRSHMCRLAAEAEHG